MSKLVAFTHGDSDGVASGALIKAFYEKQGYEVQIVFTHPVGLLSDLKEFVRDCVNITITDIALNEIHKNEILSLLEELAKSREIIYIDHHPLLDQDILPRGITWIHDTCCSTSELTYKYLSKMGLDEDYSRVALYGAIGDYLDETPWVKYTLNNWDKRSIYLEAGVLIQGLEGSRRDYDFKRRVIDHLAANSLPSTMRELVDRSLRQAIEDENLRIWVKQNIIKYGGIAYVHNPPGSVSKAANYARIYGDAKVGIAIEERKEQYIMSLRARQGIDLNKILRTLSRKLGVSGGGHPAAAGARIVKDQFKVFLDELNQEILRSLY
ncbi:MAG: DHHA1 domain-containing protein [Desulfurococcaceae archaeon]